MVWVQRDTKKVNPPLIYLQVVDLIPVVDIEDDMESSSHVLPVSPEEKKKKKKKKSKLKTKGREGLKIKYSNRKNRIVKQHIKTKSKKDQFKDVIKTVKTKTKKKRKENKPIKSVVKKKKKQTRVQL